MTSEVKKIPFLLPMIGAGVAIGLVMVVINLNLQQWFHEGWQPFQSFTFWSGTLQFMAGVILMGFLIGLSILGWILQATITDFEHIPLIFGIMLLVLSALGITLAFISGMGMLLNIFEHPASTMFYLIEAPLLFSAGGVMSMGVVGGILLIKY